LQEAYALERNELGTWTQIGYNAPGVKTGSGSGVAYATTNFTYSESSSPNWEATNNVKLNDCLQGATWTITPTFDAGTI
jgi:hypothetical protein